MKRKLVKHNMSRTRLYRIWVGIKARCCTPTCGIYYKYGARGIDVCEEWKNSFLTFAEWSYRNGYTDELTIDRIDSDKGYSPSNCKWSTYLEQNTHLKMLRTNTSGVVGVSWSKKENRWIAMISIGNKSHRIGSFKSIEKAIDARNKYIDDNHLPHQKSALPKSGDI